MSASLRSLNLVHMGDSITFGQYVDPALRWTSLVGEVLKAEFSDRVTIHSFNRGISGETTRMGLERFPTDVQALAPDVMTLQFGLNDCNCWETDRGLPRVSSSAFRANLIEMLHRARHFGAKQIILATNHRTLRRGVMPGGRVFEDANAYYSEIVRDVASATGVRLCDIRAEFMSFSDGKLDDLLLPSPDHLHLSIAGNRLYAEMILPYLRDAIAALAGDAASPNVLTAADAPHPFANSGR